MEKLEALDSEILSPAYDTAEEANATARATAAAYLAEQFKEKIR